MKKLLIISILFTGLFLTACEQNPYKYEVADGVPTITYIRLPNIASADSLIDGAYMESTICIVGKNLRSIVKVMFNDQEAVINTSYVTDNTMLIAVPKNIPEKVTNLIYFTAKGGEVVTYDFNVLVPAPSLVSMSNEFAAPGDLVAIYGDYFLDDANVPLTVTLPDGKTLSGDKLIFSKTYLGFNIPEDYDVTQTGPIKVTSIYGTTKSSFYFHDERNILFDFDGSHGGQVSGHGWRNGVIHNDGDDAGVTAIDGSYLFFGDMALTGGATENWQEDNYSINYWPEADNGYPELSSIPAFSAILKNNDISKLAVKFEVCVPADRPWGSQAMQVIFTSNEFVTYATATNSYITDAALPRGLWNPWSSMEDKLFDTNGQWITVTMPLSNFKYTVDGAVCANSLGLDGFTGLTLFVYHGGIDGVDCDPVICIDNIRVVPN